MFNFNSPNYLFLFLLFPITFYFLYYMGKNNSTIPFSFSISGSNKISFKKKYSFHTVSTIGSVALWLSMAFMIIALAEPITTTSEKKYLTGIDIIIALDNSPSMAIGDFNEKRRIDVATEVLNGYTTSLESNSIGLVTFNSEATLVVPPTVDYKIFSNRLSTIQVSSIEHGTAIGTGLGVAINHLPKNKKGLIILLTDGDNNSGEIDPLTAASLARERGIIIYTIGIGKDGRFPTTIVNEKEGTTTKTVLESKLNEDLLRKIASTTGGEFFRVLQDYSLQTIFEKIDEFESSGNRYNLTVKTTSYYSYFLIIAFIMLFIYFVIKKMILREWL